MGVLPHTYGAELTLPVLHPTLMGHRQQFRSSAPHLWGRTHTSGPPPHTYGAQQPTVTGLMRFCPTLMGHRQQFRSSAPHLWGRTHSSGALPHTYGAQPEVRGAYEVLPHTYGAQPTATGPMRFCPTLMGQNPHFWSSAPHLWGRTPTSGPPPHTYGAEHTFPDLCPTLTGHSWVFCPTLMGHRQQFRTSAPHLWGRTRSSRPLPHTYGAETAVMELCPTLMGHNNPQLWGL